MHYFNVKHLHHELIKSGPNPPNDGSTIDWVTNNLKDVRETVTHLGSFHFLPLKRTAEDIVNMSKKRNVYFTYSNDVDNNDVTTNADDDDVASDDGEKTPTNKFDDRMSSIFDVICKEREMSTSTTMTTLDVTSTMTSPEEESRRQNCGKNDRQHFKNAEIIDSILNLSEQLKSYETGFIELRGQVDATLNSPLASPQDVTPSRDNVTRSRDGVVYSRDRSKKSRNGLLPSQNGYMTSQNAITTSRNGVVLNVVDLPNDVGSNFQIVSGDEGEGTGKKNGSKLRYISYRLRKFS